MMENPPPLCCMFTVATICSKVPFKLFDDWWKETQVPECTLVNVLYLDLHVNNLEKAYKEISEAYDQLKATGNHEEITKHKPEYEGFANRFEEIKAIQTRPEWNLQIARGKASQSDWDAAEAELRKLLVKRLHGMFRHQRN